MLAGDGRCGVADRNMTWIRVELGTNIRQAARNAIVALDVYGTNVGFVFTTTKIEVGYHAPRPSVEQIVAAWETRKFDTVQVGNLAPVGMSDV